MGIAHVGMGAAGEASPVAGDQQLALGLGGTAHRMGTPNRSAPAVIDDAGELRVTGQFLEHRPRQPLPVGQFGDELAGVLIDVRNHAYVGEGLGHLAAGAAGGEIVQGVGHALVEGAPP